MAVAPYHLVPRPPRRHLLYSLVHTVEQLGLLSPMLDPHERNGVMWEDIDCGPAHVTCQGCPPTANNTSPALAADHGTHVVTSDPFTVYSDLTCGTPSRPYSVARELLAETFPFKEAREVASVFWTGTPAAGCPAINPHLADATALTTANGGILGGGGLQPLLGAIDLLEQALGVNCDGLGMLHMSRGAVAALFRDGHVNVDDEVLRSKLGTPIVVGTSYPGSDPSGNPAPTGQSWIYATGPVVIRRSDLQVVPDFEKEAIDRHVNTTSVRIQRTYTVGFDPCCRYAVLATTASDVPQGPAGTPTGATQSVRGSVTAPAAGAAIATSPALPAGTYKVIVAADVSATDTDNIQLEVGATPVGPFPSVPGSFTPVEFRVVVPAGGATISVNAIGAGTASVVYNAMLVWTPVV